MATLHTHQYSERTSQYSCPQSRHRWAHQMGRSTSKRPKPTGRDTGICHGDATSVVSPPCVLTAAARSGAALIFFHATGCLCFTSCLTLVRSATLVWASLLDGSVTLICGLVWLVCGPLQAVFRVIQGALLDAVLTCSTLRTELQES